MSKVDFKPITWKTPKTKGNYAYLDFTDKNIKKIELEDFNERKGFFMRKFNLMRRANNHLLNYYIRNGYYAKIHFEITFICGLKYKGYFKESGKSNFLDKVDLRKHIFEYCFYGFIMPYHFTYLTDRPLFLSEEEENKKILEKMNFWKDQMEFQGIYREIMKCFWVLFGFDLKLLNEEEINFNYLIQEIKNVDFEDKLIIMNLIEFFQLYK